jgi:DNA-binding winged helix-turn-helix (wHTH) protein
MSLSDKAVGERLITCLLTYPTSLVQKDEFLTRIWMPASGRGVSTHLKSSVPNWLSLD